MHTPICMLLPVEVYAANGRYCTFMEEQCRTAVRLLSAHNVDHAVTARSS